MGFLFGYLASFLPFVSRRRYDEVLRLNQLAKAELERWTNEEKKWARRNHLLLFHNATLRDMLIKRVWLEDTNGLVEEVKSMIGDMQSIVDDAKEKDACTLQRFTNFSST